MDKQVRKGDATLTGLAWYDEFQYARLLEAAVDAKSMPKTYDAWLKKCLMIEAEAVRAGALILRVYVDVGVLARWCIRNGRPNDGAARAAYAAEEVHRSGRAGITTNDPRGRR